jgi:hypothetical protein
MTKAQIAAVFLAGAGAGAAPGAVFNAMTSGVAVAHHAHPVAHAVDLRRSFGGTELRVAVYGNAERGDGGYVDLGVAKACTPLTVNAEKACNLCMAAAGAACDWR